MVRVWKKLAAAALLGAVAAPASAQTVEAGPIVNPANGHSYYRVFWAGVNYDQIRGFAQSLGGDLATINNDAENTWVWANLVQPHGSNCYIGLTDAASEGTFTWLNGEPVTYTNWGAGEPNGGTGENYAHMYPGALTWNDANGTGVNHAIVEVENNGSCIGAREITPGTINFDTLDLAGQLSGPCGWSGPKVWFTFVGAEREVSFDTCAGANFDTVIEAYRGDCGSLSCVAWNDDSCFVGSAVGFFAKAGQRYYISVQSYYSDSGPGFNFNLAFNQSVPPGAPTIEYGPVYNPATGTSYYRTTPGLWQDQQQVLAQTIEGNLVTINDGGENFWVWNNFVFGQDETWIGLNDRANEGTYVWASGQNPGYFNWIPGEPNDSGNEDYTVLTNVEQWNDLNGAAARSAVVEVTNDSCYGAQPLVVPSSVNSGYFPANPGVGEIGCGHSGAFGRGVWFSVYGDGSTINAQTCGGITNFDTTLRVLTGDCASVSCIGGVDDQCAGGASSISFYAEPGRTYYIVVGSYIDFYWGGNFTLSVSNSGPPTPPAFTSRSDVNAEDCSRYYGMSEGLFQQASATAREYGLHLATVSSAQDNAFIWAFALASGYGSPWIGFTDIGAPEGQFTWLDGSPVTYTNWDGSEPNGGPYEYFTTMFGGGLWNDLPETVLPSIAEARIDADIGGYIRGAIEFNDDAVALPINFWGAWPRSSFTIECWFRTTIGGVIMGQFGVIGGHVPMLYVGTDGRLRAADWAGDVNGSLLTGPVINNGAWHHVAFVRSGGTVQLIVDGALNAQRTTTPQGYDPSGLYQYYIGTGLSDSWPADTSSDGFRGDIDEFRVWNVARSVAQINSTKNTRYFNPANYGNDLITCLDFDDAGGGLAFDTTGHGLHGQLFGDPIWLYENRNGDKTPDVCETNCPADIDGNGVVNSTDVSAFINMWFADQASGTINADFNRDGTSNSTDVSDMINAYFAAGKGCI